MTARNYNQACSFARFFDVLGSRWTLLIIRDLLARPRQFKELLECSPSIGPNLLARRLRELGEEGIAEKIKVDGEPVRYQLTQKGKSLEPLFGEIIRWSLRHLPVDHNSPGVGRPDLLVVVFRALFQADQAANVNETYQLNIDGLAISLHVRNCELTTSFDKARKPAFELNTTSEVLDQVGSGVLSMESALGSARAVIQGDDSAFERFVRIFSQPSTV